MSDSGAADRRHAPWLFLGATLLWSGLFWGLAILLGPWGLSADGSLLALALYVVGGFGPAIVASALIAGGRGDETLGEFWRRTLDPRRLALRYWLLVITVATLPPLARWLAADGSGIAALLTGPPTFLLVGFAAGIAEEPGWRGYAQEGLQRRIGPLPAALVIGVFWAAWHLPLFWIAGTYQHGLGLGTGSFWMFHVNIMISAVLVAWLYNASGHVILAAVLFHAVGNLVNEMFSVDGGALLETLITAALVLAALTISWRWMSRPLAPAMNVERS